MDELRATIEGIVTDAGLPSGTGTADAVLAAIRATHAVIERRHLERLKYSLDHGNTTSAIGHARFIVHKHLLDPIQRYDADLARDAPEGEG